MRILIKLLAFMVLLFSAYILYDRQDMRTPMAFEALERINPIPKTQQLINANKLSEAEEYLSFFMAFEYMKTNQEAQTLLNDIKSQRADIVYKTQNILNGIWTGKSDELEGQISAGVSDFFLFGDLRDLTIEGYHHVKGEEVDQVLVALSTIGVVATGATLVTAGSSTPVKVSLSFLKHAKKVGKLPSWLGKHLIKVSKKRDFSKVKPLFTDLFTLVKGAGTSGGLKLLHNTKGLDSLKDAVGFSKMYGKNSSTLITIVGKDVVTYQKGVSKTAFLHASTYGKVGVKRLGKLGEKGFLKSLVKPIKTSRMLKIFDKNISNVLKQIPDGVFYVLGLVALLLVM